MRDITISLVQFDIAWCDSAANLAQLDTRLRAIDTSPDLVILPETFTSGFFMQPADVAQAMKGPAVTWMRDSASSMGAHIMGSLIIVDDNRYHNRLVCAHPDGSISYYDKRHLFSYAGEHHQFTPGNHRLEININDWKVCPLICYDLRFPVWSRNTTDYDLLVYVANWPAVRTEAWSSLLKARAIENQCFTVGVNRTGSDGNGIDYAGASVVFDMGGQKISELGGDDATATVKLSHADLAEYRKRYNFLADRDSYTIE